MARRAWHLLPVLFGRSFAAGTLGVRARRVLAVGGVLLLGGTGTAYPAPMPSVPRPAPTIDSAVDTAVAESGRARVIVVYRDRGRPDAWAGAHRVLDGGRAIARTVTADELAALAADTDVAAVVTDRTRSMDALDPGWEHAAAHLHSPAVDDAARNGTGQVVAVLDTGVLSAHDYFTNNGTAPTRVLPGACFATDKFGEGACPNGTSTQYGAGSAEPCAAPDCVHGTHVAGIVAGRDDGGGGLALRGVAPAAQILPIRVFSVPAPGDEPVAYDSDVLAALEYVYAQRATYRLAAVNLSLGGGHAKAACDADPDVSIYVDVIGRLRAAGIATTVAAGNDGWSDAVQYPACVSSAVTVGATMSFEGAPGSETVAWFSDRLAGVTDFVAPGYDIVSSISTGPGDFDYMSGTSMAAPMVAGAFADIRSTKTIDHDVAGLSAIVTALSATATPISDGWHAFPRPDITDAIGALVSPPSPPVPPPPPPPDVTGRFVPVPPQRLLDTRQTVGGRLPAGHVGSVTVGDVGVVPGTVSAAALNMTVVDPGGSGFLTVFACAGAAPDTSNVNFRAGQTVANLVVVGVSASDTVCFQGNADLDVVVDLMGMYGEGAPGAYGAVTPARALDTRFTAALAPGQVVPIALGGYFGVPADALAAVLNVTATHAAAGGFLTVFPCASTAPDTSNVNFVTGRAVPNEVLVGLTAGRVCVQTNQPTNVLVDVSGYFAPPPAGHGRFTPIVPGRLIDTRAFTKPLAHTVVVVATLGREGVPLDATAVALNVTVDGPSGLGFLTVFPCTATTPDASNVNYVAGLTVANSVMVGIGLGGAVCVYTEASADVLVDVSGYYRG